MKETIVAQRPLAPAIIGLAAVAALFLGVASTVSFFRAVLLLAFGAYWGWKLFRRITRMRLAVTDEKVIVVPGGFFDINPGRRRPDRASRFRRFARFSFGPPIEELRRGLDGLARAIG